MIPLNQGAQAYVPPAPHTPPPTAFTPTPTGVPGGIVTVGGKRFGMSGGSDSYDPSITLDQGYTPDYTGLIQDDQGYQAAQSAAAAAQQQADASRRAAVRDEYIKYGGNLPAGWTDTYGDIDQATKEAAASNQYSTIAGLKDNYSKSVSAFQKALAARGMLQSGDLSYGQDQLDRGLGQSEYDAANNFLGQTAGNYGTYAGVLGQNANNITNALFAAEGNVYSNPANRPIAPRTANYDATASAKYGRPIYNDGNGGLFSADGQGFSVPGGLSDDNGAGGATWTPPEYGPDAGYTPDGSAGAPGVYTSGGGGVYYQSHQGPYGNRVMR